MRKARRKDIVTQSGKTVILIESTPEARTKSGKVRVVPLNSSALEALEQLGSDYLIPRMTKQSFSRHFKNDARRAGFVATIHCTRHTFCTHLAAKRVPVNVIKELAGHSSISVTEIYLWVLAGARDSAVEALNL